MLTITEPEKVEESGTITDEKKAKKRVVMILARQHPGESPGSFVAQGAMCW